MWWKPWAVILWNIFPQNDYNASHTSLSRMQENTPSPVLLKALHAVMRPIVRLLLRKGMTYPFFADMLKGVFVAVASQEFRLSGAEPSDSRITLLTGVHRKDVRRLREQGGEVEAPLPEEISFGAHLVSVWLNQAPFCASRGVPLPLPRRASAGGACSFDGLVASVSKDIRARVVLDEWRRLGIVRLDDEGMVHLETAAFVPTRGFDEKAAYFGHNIHDHAAAAVHNLTTAGKPFFERSVHYNALSPKGVAELESAVHRDGMNALLAFNELASSLEKRDELTVEPRQRITVGLYFYSEALNDVPADGKD